MVVNESETNSKQAIDMVCTEPASIRRTMSPSLPPHHHIRGDDTNEMENITTHDSIKSNRRYFSTSSDHTPPSLHQRLFAQLQNKSRLVSWCLYILLIILVLVILLLIAFGIYWFLTNYYEHKPIPVNTSMCLSIMVIP